MRKRDCGRMSIELDENNPDTPVMVYIKSGNKILASATYHCASSECEVEGYELTSEEIMWLNLHDNECCEFYDEYRVID